MNTYSFGYFVIKRWMVSTVIDIILCLIPGLGAVCAPVKTIAKQYGKTVLKTNLKTPFTKFIKFVASKALTLLNGLVKIVKKIPFIGSKLAKKIPVKKWTETIAGATSSATINKVLNRIVENIDMQMLLN